MVNVCQSWEGDCNVAGKSGNGAKHTTVCITEYNTRCGKQLFAYDVDNRVELKCLGDYTFSKLVSLVQLGGDEYVLAEF